MNVSELLALLLGVLCPLACFALMIVAVVGAMVGLPLMYRSTFVSWTEGRTPREAWDAIAVGATRGFLQIRPGSYLYEDVFDTERTPADVLDHIAAKFSGLLLSVLARDDEGIAVNMRFPPQAGPGWVGVVLCEPADGGTRVRARFRSTYAFGVPVLTFFLSLQLRINLRRLLTPV